MSSNAKVDSVIVDVTIAAPVAEVWQALRDPEQLKNWFGWDAETLAEEIRFIFFDHGTPNADGTVLQFGEYEGTSDRFELIAEGDRTRVRVVRSGVPPAEGWGKIYDDMVEGWITFVEQLRLLLERHRGETRRTIYLSGRRTVPGPLPIEALGLHGAQQAEVFGARIGSHWHRSGFQAGVLVPAWNDALLIATDMPAPRGGDLGGGSLLLTTFGLNDATFATLENDISEWWQANHPPKPAA